MILDAILFLLLFWFSGLLGTCTILLLWFSTTLPVEIAILLRGMGFIQKAATIMPDAGLVGPRSLEDFTRSDFDNWLSLLETSKLLGRRKTHIMQCRGCFSVYAGLLSGIITAAGLCIMTGYVPTPMAAAYIVLTAPLTWSWAACRLTSTTHKP